MNQLIGQYKAIKEKYKDTILLFRVGDFYQTFNEDAALLGERMGILVIEEDGNKGIKNTASLPFHSLDSALRLLTKAGYKVAVCDPLEEPKSRPMKRDATEVKIRNKQQGL
jgi:DNA mismatch repair protein MutS